MKNVCYDVFTGSEWMTTCDDYFILFDDSETFIKNNLYNNIEVKLLEVKKQELLAIQILNDQTNIHSLVYCI